MKLEPLSEKWVSFGWNVIEVDGHDHANLREAFQKAIDESSKPTVILANTIMGKGIPSIENDYKWHGKAPSKEQALQFLHELTH